MAKTSKKNWFAFKKYIFTSLATGVLCGLFAILLSSTSLFKLIELRTIDFRFHLRSVLQTPPPAGDIVIIAIDEETFKKIQEPILFWVRYYASIIENLSECGAKAIGFDIIQSRSTDQFLESLLHDLFKKINKDRNCMLVNEILPEILPRWDASLARAASRGDVVLACYINDSDGKFMTPIEQISFAVQKENLAPVNLPFDEDKILRKQPVYLTDSSGDGHFCFGIEVASKYLGENIKLDKNKRYIIGDNTILTDDNYNMLINYSGPAGTFRTVPFWRVKENALLKNKDFFKKELGKKIVLIGNTDPALQDTKNTPFGLMPGTEVIANAINTIISRDYLSRAGRLINLVILFFMCILASGLCFNFSLSRSLVLSILTSFLFVFSALYLFSYKNIIINMSLPFTGILLTYGASLAYRYVTQEREKNKIRKLFERYVSKPVVDKIIDDPASLRLGGDYAEVSVLFSDINGFTALSEGISPREVIDLLNEYFDLMIDVVFKYNGTLKQFVGDEIMAIYGAPYPQSGHAVFAAKTAVEMKEKLESWKVKRIADGKKSFDVKIGLHTGRVVCGNVGSSKRTEYTAVGDVVNTASRVMGLNSIIGTGAGILATREFYELVKNEINARHAGKFPVKGKNVEVDVYEILNILPGDQGNSKTSA